MWISTLYSYFQPFWWFCGQLLRIEEELGPKAIYAGENWRPKVSSWKHNQPYMCSYLLYTHTHTHTYTYIVYMCMCMIASIYTKWLSFYHFFFTLFSLSFFFLHFGVYRMLNIIFATCLSIGKKKFTRLNMTWKLSNYPNVQKPFYYCFFPNYHYNNYLNITLSQLPTTNWSLFIIYLVLYNKLLDQSNHKLIIASCHYYSTS
jgi:hypothetical protein